MRFVYDYLEEDVDYYLAMMLVARRRKPVEFFEEKKDTFTKEDIDKVNEVISYFTLKKNLRVYKGFATTYDSEIYKKILEIKEFIKINKCNYKIETNGKIVEGIYDKKVAKRYYNISKNPVKVLMECIVEKGVNCFPLFQIQNSSRFLYECNVIFRSDVSIYIERIYFKKLKDGEYCKITLSMK